MAWKTPPGKARFGSVPEYEQLGIKRIVQPQAKHQGEWTASTQSVPGNVSKQQNIHVFIQTLQAHERDRAHLPLIL